MFDNLPQPAGGNRGRNVGQTSSGFNPSGFGPAPVIDPASQGAASSSPAVAETGGPHAAEDMFAGMEKRPLSSAEPVGKHPAFRPKTPGPSLPPSEIGFDHHSRFKQYSAIAFGSVLLILLLVSGVWIFGKVFHSADNAVLPADSGLATPPAVPSSDIADTVQPAASQSDFAIPNDNVGEKALAPADDPASNLDADQDGLSDADEAKYGTDKMFADSDQDNLSDRDEIRVYHTDPLNSDTDGDGYKDGDEVRNGFNPLGPGRLSEMRK